MMSHSYAIVVICIKIIYYSYDAGFLLFLAHIWMRIVGWIHGWLFKITLLETWWWWVLTYMMIGCFICWLMILGSCSSGWLWCFSHMIQCEWFFIYRILFKRMSWYGNTLMIHALIQVAGLVANDRCYGADHTMLLLMFIMILFRCLVFVINIISFDVNVISRLMM